MRSALNRDSRMGKLGPPAVVELPRFGSIESCPSPRDVRMVGSGAPLPSGYVASGCLPGAASAVGRLLTTMSKPDVAVVRRCRSTYRELVSDLTRRETPLIIFDNEAGA